MEALVSNGLDRTLWQGRRVFLTGHTGFKGGWLALWLRQLGAQVCGYALDPDTQPNLMEAARVGRALQDLRGDINDLAHLTDAITAFAPEIVFHMAAQPLVRRSYADPLLTYRTNVMGTAHVLEAIRATSSVRAVVVVTTDKCYENLETGRAFREGDPLGGHDPYSSSKACAELVASAYRSSYFDNIGCLIATARAGNVIGGGDSSADRLLPDLVQGFLSGHPVTIRRPESVRPWQHVLEPLHGYLRLAEELYRGNRTAASAWNFGPSQQDAWTVSRIADTMAALWGGTASWINDTDPGVHEAGYLMLDASKAQRELGWQPKLPLETALEWLVAWYRAQADGADMQAETLRQIAAYEALL